MGSLKDVHYLLAAREDTRRLDGMLHRAQIARAIGLSSTDPHLREVFDGLEDAVREGRPPEVAGVAVNAGYHRFERQRAFYVHVDDAPRIGVEVWKRSGRPLPAGTAADIFGAGWTPAWLTRTEVAFACNLNPYHPAFIAAWEEAMTGALGTFEGGPLVRLMRKEGRSRLFVHERGVDAFRRRLGVRGPTLPAKRNDQASFGETAHALGISLNMGRVRAQWDLLVEDCAREGRVVREGRGIGFGFVRGANGRAVAALDRSELGWFAELTGVAHLIDRDDEWLTMNEAARAIATSPYATPALKELWQEIRRAHEEGASAPVAGRTWRGAMAKGSEVASFRLHRSEVDALAAAIGRDRDKLMTEEWLTVAKVGGILNQSPTRGVLPDAWRDLLGQLRAGGIPTLQGRAFRMEDRLLAGKWIPCLHVSEVDALGRATGGRRSSGPKDEQWLGMGDAAAHFGKHQSDPTFGRAWRDLVVAACAGPVLDGTRPVRFEYRTATKAVWCIHRDEIEWFGARAWPRRRGSAPRPYVPLAKVRIAEGGDGLRDAFDLLVEEVDASLRDASPLTLLGRDGLRFQRLPDGGMAVHPDDVADFLDAVRELSGPVRSP